MSTKNEATATPDYCPPEPDRARLALGNIQYMMGLAKQAIEAKSPREAASHWNLIKHWAKDTAIAAKLAEAQALEADDAARRG